MGFIDNPFWMGDLSRNLNNIGKGEYGFYGPFDFYSDIAKRKAAERMLRGSRNAFTGEVYTTDDPQVLSIVEAERMKDPSYAAKKQLQSAEAVIDNWKLNPNPQTPIEKYYQRLVEANTPAQTQPTQQTTPTPAQQTAAIGVPQYLNPASANPLPIQNNVGLNNAQRAALGNAMTTPKNNIPTYTGGGAGASFKPLPYPEQLPFPEMNYANPEDIQARWAGHMNPQRGTQSKGMGLQTMIGRMMRDTFRPVRPEAQIQYDALPDAAIGREAMIELIQLMGQDVDRRNQGREAELSRRERDDQRAQQRIENQINREEAAFQAALGREFQAQASVAREMDALREAKNAGALAEFNALQNYANQKQQIDQANLNAAISMHGHNVDRQNAIDRINAANNQRKPAGYPQLVQFDDGSQAFMTVFQDGTKNYTPLGKGVTVPSRSGLSTDNTDKIPSKDAAYLKVIQDDIDGLNSQLKNLMPHSEQYKAIENAIRENQAKVVDYYRRQNVDEGLLGTAGSMDEAELLRELGLQP